MKIKIYITVALLFSFLGMSYAQTQVLSGTVTEISDLGREPLVGVNVSIVNSQDRTLGGSITDINGQYNVKVPAGESNLTIVYSYIGMKSQRIKYTGQATLNVIMKSDAVEVDELVVQAERIYRNDMGISSKEMVSANQRLDVSLMAASIPATSVDDILQGQLSGVDITLGGGDPGTRSTIRIRGTSTLNASSDPLIVIDGVPYPSEVDDTFDFSTANEEDLGALLNISPADIESVEVLKDASATAIWGSQGANGVLVINTKKGVVGKTRFNFSSKFSVKTEPSTIPMLNGNEYTALMQDAIWNSANYVGVNNASSYIRLLYDTPEIGYNPDWQYFNEFNADTDWLDLIGRTAYTTENNFSMSGGGNKATYRFSLGYLNEEGTTIGNALNRFNTSLNINYQFSNKLKFGADLSFSQSDKDANWSTNTRSVAFGKMPNKSPYAIDRNTGEATDEYFVYQTSDWEGIFSFGSKEDGSKATNFNPVAMVNESKNNTLQRENKVTFNTEYKILPGFTYRAYASIGMRTTKVTKFLPQEVTAVPWTNQYANLLSENYSERLSIQTENKLTYTKNWNQMHNLIANGIFRTSQTASSSYSGSASGIANQGLADLISGSNVQTIKSGESESRSISAIGFANYTLADRYIVQGTIAMEGNSAMGSKRRFGYFPSAGLSWLIQNEPFMEALREKFLDQAKIRIGIGQSGRAPNGNYVYVGAYRAGDNYMNMSSIEPARIQLDKLKWETSTEYNIGADFSLFNGRLKLTLDYYERYAKDLLQKNVDIASSTGFSKINYFNSGKMTNKGWEARADVIIYNKGGWQISGNVNLSRNENKITEMPVNMSFESGIAEGDADVKNGQYAFRVIEGQPIGSFYGYRYKGVYKDKASTYALDANGKVMNDVNGNPIIMKNGAYTCYAGDAMYEDINHDGVINKYDIVYLGNSMPTLTGGAGLTVKYKAISLNAFFHGRFGQSIVNTTRMNNESMYGRSNQSKAVLRRWRSEGDVTDIPRALYNEGRNYLGSDRFVEDASYLRLKTITLNYAFPKKFCNSLGINTLSIYATGYNLFTWTDYTGQDPEVKTPSSPTKLAEDGATTPISKQLSFGLNLNF